MPAAISTDVMPTPELAAASLNGMITARQANGIIVTGKISVFQQDGGWVATTEIIEIPLEEGAEREGEEETHSLREGASNDRSGTEAASIQNDAGLHPALLGVNTAFHPVPGLEPLQPEANINPPSPIEPASAAPASSDMDEGMKKKMVEDFEAAETAATLDILLNGSSLEEEERKKESPAVEPV
jgi:hypothetical protein